MAVNRPTRTARVVPCDTNHSLASDPGAASDTAFLSDPGRHMDRHGRDPAIGSWGRHRRPLPRRRVRNQEQPPDLAPSPVIRARYEEQRDNQGFILADRPADESDEIRRPRCTRSAGPPVIQRVESPVPFLSACTQRHKQIRCADEVWTKQHHHQKPRQHRPKQTRTYI